MATSNQYEFAKIDADYVVRDAFNRCELSSNLISGYDLDSARRSLNFILSKWINYGLNLFTVQQGILPIVTGQTRFELPQFTLSKILEANLVKANQILGGTASSSPVASGSSTSVFQTTPGVCVLDDPDGDFVYTYTIGQPITYVGILSNITADYTLYIECAFTDAPEAQDWITILRTPLTTYYLGQAVFYSLPFQKTAVSWRIRETGGAILNMAQISLDIPYQIQPMATSGRDQYFKAAQNNQQGAPTTYWFDRSSQPALNVYPAADTQYQFMVFNYTNSIQDVNSFFDSLPVVERFLEPVCAALAAAIAVKKIRDPQLRAELTAIADITAKQALGEDTEQVDSIVVLGNQTWQ